MSDHLESISFSKLLFFSSRSELPTDGCSLVQILVIHVGPSIKGDANSRTFLVVYSLLWRGEFN